MGLNVLLQSSPTEKHSCSVSAVSLVDENLISGSDDGTLKLWTPDLKLIKEIQTEKGGVLSLATTNDAVYTCGSDQTIQAWDKISLENIGQVQTSLVIPLKVFAEPKTNLIWAADSIGDVSKFKNRQEIAKFHLIEEVWDFVVTSEPDFIYTARDRDITVSEIIPGKRGPVLKATIEGRSPVCILGDKLCCLEREGRNIMVCDNSADSKFKLLRKIPASELIINALCPQGDSAIYCGGYDSKIGLWDVNSAACLGLIDVGCCVNALQSTSTGAVAAVSDGRLALVGPNQ